MEDMLVDELLFACKVVVHHMPRHVKTACHAARRRLAIFSVQLAPPTPPSAVRMREHALCRLSLNGERSWCVNHFCSLLTL